MEPGGDRRLGHAARVAAACVPALLAVIWLTIHRGGLGLTYDSVAYASTRRLLEAGHGLHFAHLWPPASAAVLVLTGTGAGAVVANCGALVAYLVCCYALAHAVTGRTGLATGVTVWVGLSIATIQAYSMMWSEPLFYAAVTAALLALVRIHQGGSVRWFVLLVVACNVAFLSRYAGVTLIGFAGAALTWSLWPRRGWRSFAWVVPTIAAASVTAVVVMISNVAAGDPAMGQRWPSTMTWLKVAKDASRTVTSFVINRPYVTGAWWVGALVLLALLVAVWRSGWSRRGPEMVLAAWVVVYVVSIVYGEMTTLLDPARMRYFAVAQPAAAILVAPFVARVLRRPRWVLAVAAACFMVETAAVWVNAHSYDVFSYTTVRESYSRLPGLVDESVPAQAPILSNLPQWVAATTSRDRLVGFADAGPGVAGRPSWLPKFKVADAAPGDYVVWLGGRRAKQRPEWDLVGQAPGVLIFRVP